MANPPVLFPVNPVRVPLPPDQSGFGGSFAGGVSGIGGFSAPTISAPSLPPNASQLIPFGSANPVTITAADVAAIIAAVNAQQINGQAVMLSKQGAVNALTAIGDVIAYDATTGW
jgi:hypothetical protein